MARLGFLVVCALAFLASSMASAAVVEHTFNVQNLTVTRLYNRQVVTAVNGSLPGPTTIRVREGDTLIVHVFNKSPYNISIHWHAVFQLLSAWADGPGYVTQCPIRPGSSYTYKFKIAAPKMPSLPRFNDTTTTHKFNSKITGTVGAHWVPVPRKVNEHMLLTVGLGLAPCGRKGNNSFGVPVGGWAVIRFTANNPGTYMGKNYSFFYHNEGDYDNHPTKLTDKLLIAGLIIFCVGTVVTIAAIVIQYCNRKRARATEPKAAVDI